MKLYTETNDFKLYEGSMLDMLEFIPPCSIDSIVTDPPYGLTTITKRFGKEGSAVNQYGRDGSFARLTKGFMGKEWDGSGIEYNVEAWRKCYQVLKHGGYLLAFGGSRTCHRIACAIEDAGFEIRDTIMWLYGSGFPKSMNIGLMIDKKNGIESPVISSSDFPDIRSGNYENNDGSRIIVEQRKATNEWDGWGTALKPAYEPVIVARKPCEGSCVDNVMKYRTGAINIDGCRIGTDERSYKGMSANKPQGAGVFRDDDWQPKDMEITVNGRYPSNVILTYDETDKAEVCGGMPETQEESAARYYYCAKASKRDRDEGLDQYIEISFSKGEFTCAEVGAAVQLLKKVTSDLAAVSLSMYEYGDNIMVKFHKENRSIIKTAINKIIELKTLNLSNPCITKEFTADANCEMVSGTNHAESAANSNELKQTITNENQALVRGASNVVLETLLKIRNEENWKTAHNSHCTVKPCDLMQYLVRLVTPPHGTILDPFNGSGSTGKAAMYENRDRNAGYKYIGIELTAEYLPIADARIRYAAGDNRPVEYPEKPAEGQITFFDLLGGEI